MAFTFTTHHKSARKALISSAYLWHRCTITPPMNIPIRKLMLSSSERIFRVLYKVLFDNSNVKEYLYIHMEDGRRHITGVGPHLEAASIEWDRIQSVGAWALFCHRVYKIYILEHKHTGQPIEGWFSASESGRCFKCQETAPVEMVTAWKLLQMGGSPE
jgi:hypothetical protein